MYVWHNVFLVSSKIDVGDVFWHIWNVMSVWLCMLFAGFMWSAIKLWRLWLDIWTYGLWSHLWGWELMVNSLRGDPFRWVNLAGGNFQSVGFRVWRILQMSEKSSLLWVVITEFYQSYRWDPFSSTKFFVEMQKNWVHLNFDAENPFFGDFFSDKNWELGRKVWSFCWGEKMIRWLVVSDLQAPELPGLWGASYGGMPLGVWGVEVDPIDGNVWKQRFESKNFWQGFWQMGWFKAKKLPAGLV